MDIISCPVYRDTIDDKRPNGIVKYFITKDTVLNKRLLRLPWVW